MTSKKGTVNPPASTDPSSPSTDCNPRPPKRTRRMTESQLSRKRELDRAAQRNSRARTRDRIEHLENLVKSLRADADADRVTALLQQVNTKEHEIQRLKGVLSKIGKQLDLAVQGSPLLELKQGKQQLDISDSEEDQPSSPDSPMQLCDQPTEAPVDQMTLDTTPLRFDPCDDEPPNQQAVALNYSIAIATGLPSAPCQSIGQLASSIASNTNLEGRQWYLAGAILNHILSIPDDTVITTAFDEEIAIRAVFHGWTSVIERYSLDRGWQWLKELDERIYFNASIPLRLMHLRFCRLMFLQQRFPDDGWGALLPWWFSMGPDELNMGDNTDALAAYFAWPKFRQKIRQSPRRFATTKFMNAFVANVDCTWTSDMRDLYKKDPITGLYQYSDLVGERVNDIRCFNMGKEFFDIFPELRGDIPCRAVLPQSLFPTGMEERWDEAEEIAKSLARRRRPSQIEAYDDACHYPVEGIGSPLPGAIAQICEILV